MNNWNIWLHINLEMRPLHLTKNSWRLVNLFFVIPLEMGFATSCSSPRCTVTATVMDDNVSSYSRTSLFRTPAIRTFTNPNTVVGLKCSQLYYVHTNVTTNILNWLFFCYFNNDFIATKYWSLSVQLLIHFSHVLAVQSVKSTDVL